jgi:plastocyanin
MILLILSLSLVLSSATQQSAVALRMTGQQCLPNGTGIAYFDDNSTSQFEHPFTAERGFYYDNSTIFYTGNIPETISGIGNTSGRTADTSTNATSCSGSSGGTTPSTSGLLNLFGPDAAEEGNNIVNGASGDNVNVTIIYGASVLDNKSRAFEPNPVRIKVGDTVTWINQDLNLHDLHSPPRVPTSGGVLSSTTFFGLVSENGGTFSCTFNRPGGFHYADSYDPNMKGAIIVEDR